MESNQAHHPSRLSIRLQVGGPVNKYPAKAHARRVAHALAEAAPFDISGDLIVVTAAQSRPWPDSDMPAPFRQARYFYYLTGCNEPGCCVVYDIKHDKLTLWLPAIDQSRVVWTGRGSTVEEALEKYDIDEARYLTKSSSPLARCLDHDEVVYIHDEHDVLPVSIPRSLKRPALQNRLKQAMDACRVIKDDHEIDLIQRANQISSDAHVAVFKSLHAFTNEAQVEATYMAHCIASHAKEQAYAPIAGSGPNGATLHYGANTADFDGAETLVLDAGCEASCYASDVTRTVPINPSQPGTWPSPEAKQIYALVQEVQEACIAQMRPGKAFTDIVALSRRMTLEGLLKLGILKGDVDEIEKWGTVSGFFPHGLGHHVGLDVHDVSPVPHPPAIPRAAISPVDQREANVSAEEDGLEEDEDDWEQTAEEFEAEAAFLKHAFQYPIPPSLLPSWSFHTSPLFFSRYDSTSLLRPGMVVTIEPGIYFNRSLLEQVFLSDPYHSRFIDEAVLDRYWKVGGVRIEDDILITRDGYENLTPAPKGREMCGIIQRGGDGDGDFQV
ncbi:putative Xaa-Pro aminopeptidase [Hortaea werneckii]|uniref:Xaa-Pro aminopeptidase n=1 Tax=Hortaea werneckii TaxID=91943 RepID=A0A3M7E687_HORWE|nr:putative Xaa-Pro aminopeptidase [Hortaea werneckii]KAI7569104.1 putative Xaa-Pro aminopeptidase [Hortaea werneckii]KAI7618880.1 putative Xaa-Pro aminopeptidase [Hortaea werneckii]KAI7633489.1 putative Xaa-Pro aminopeptidase [Hortaea werneckii]KAI7668787.1 putative Xaa-Pro aminopeptidase [Hortaea werneckii]